MWHHCPAKSCHSRLNKMLHPIWDSKPWVYLGLTLKPKECPWRGIWDCQSHLLLHITCDNILGLKMGTPPYFNHYVLLYSKWKWCLLVFYFIVYLFTSISRCKLSIFIHWYPNMWWMKTTLNCPISVGCHLQLHIVITFQWADDYLLKLDK